MRRTVMTDTTTIELPQANYQLWQSGDDAQRAEFSKTFGDSCREHGFVTVVNHAISAEKLDEYYRLAREFFNYPTEEKLAFHKKGSNNQRGYTPFGTEHAKQSEVADLKEFVQHGQPNGAGFGYPENIAITKPARFHQLAEELYVEYQHMGIELMRAIAMYLDFEFDFFTPLTDTGNSIFRTIYYPPIKAEPASAIRAEAHEDINLITLLVSGSSSGLQVKNTRDEWVDVTLIPGQLTINVGDMLMRMTNGYLPSTTHRVKNPPREEWHNDRISTPFFLHPISEMDLTVRNEFVSDNNPPRFDPISAGDYLDQRLREIGLAK